MRDTKASFVMGRVLSSDFFNRPALIIAQELLGKFLVISDLEGVERAFMIREVEAYDGPLDQASHAFRGRTERTKVMFGEAGYWYVYLIYGMYWMLNVVTGSKDYPAAILIRAVEGYDGPGKLTKALGIDKRFHERATDRKAGLWIEDRGSLPTTYRIRKTPRIGVAYAGPVWSKKLYRFVLEEKRRDRLVHKKSR